jgi:microcystin-dependent protein
LCSSGVVISNISNTYSTYTTGGIDTQTTLNGTYQATFQQMNGAASGVIAIETVLGDGPTLKGNKADLVTRLGIPLNADGEVLLNTNGVFANVTEKYGLIGNSANKKLIPKNIMPIGAMIEWSTDTAPAHWVLCYGQAINRTTYADLFAVVSTTYGVGDGSTTFNVPDLRGRTPIGTDDMGGSAASRITSASTNGANAVTLGGVGGAETHTLSAAETPVLTARSLASSGGGTTAIGIARSTTAATVTDENLVNISGGGAHSNTQPWIALSYIIYAGA